MKSMQFDIDEEEKDELCKRFDTQKNGRYDHCLLNQNHLLGEGVISITLDFDKFGLVE